MIIEFPDPAAPSHAAAHIASRTTLQIARQASVRREAAAAAPTDSWNAGRSSTRPACANISRATWPATRPRARRWANWRKASNVIRKLESILANRKKGRTALPTQTKRSQRGFIVVHWIIFLPVQKALQFVSRAATH